MESAKYVRWIIPFKKFGMVRVKKLVCQTPLLIPHQCIVSSASWQIQLFYFTVVRYMETPLKRIIYLLGVTLKTHLTVINYYITVNIQSVCHCYSLTLILLEAKVTSVYNQHRARPAYTSMQSDQALYPSSGSHLDISKMIMDISKIGRQVYRYSI